MALGSVGDLLRSTPNGALIGTKDANDEPTWNCPEMNVPSGGTSTSCRTWA